MTDNLQPATVAEFTKTIQSHVHKPSFQQEPLVWLRKFHAADERKGIEWAASTVRYSVGAGKGRRIIAVIEVAERWGDERHPARARYWIAN